MSVVWSLTGTTVTDTTLYMFHTVNGCIMRVYWFYSLLSFSVVHSSSFFLAFITVAVVCVMDLVVWNKRGLDWIGLQDNQSRCASHEHRGNREVTRTPMTYGGCSFWQPVG